MNLVSASEPMRPVLGSFSTRGGRSLQQDMHLKMQLKAVSKKEAEKLIADAMGSAAETVRSMSQAQYAGTTATIAVITKDNELVIGQVGDSPVMFFTQDGKTGEITCHEKLISAHAPDNPLERTRVETQGGQVKFMITSVNQDNKRSHFYFDPEDEKGRKKKLDEIWESGGKVLSGRLMVFGEEYSVNLTRSLGDTSIAGLSDKPETTVINLNDYLAHPNSRVWVVVASDGLNDGIKAREIGQQLAKGDALALQAKTLSELAVMGGSGDNITTTIAELRPGNNASAILSVMDGHGKFGDAIANAVRKQLGVAIGRHGLDPDDRPTAAFPKQNFGNDSSAGRG